jgi:hypothetical protein
MRSLAIVVTALAMTLPLCACGGGKSYQKEGAVKRQAEVALENCRWEAEHEQQADGTWVESDRDGDETDAYIKECMNKKGFELKEDAGGDSGWWPF